MIIKSLIDTDLYKLTIGQLAFHQQKNKPVKYSFVCRNKEIDLIPFQKEISDEIDNVCELTFSEEELSFLKNLKNGDIFKSDFIDYLRTFKLKRSDVSIFIKDNKLNIDVNGHWHETVFWEIIILSITNEIYFRNTQKNANKDLGIKKLYEKINLVKELNLESNQFNFVEFGTRRRYSFEWQKEVCSILKKELSNKGFLGTSNIYLGFLLDIPVLGTTAHELFSYHQSIGNEESYINCQEVTLNSWLKEYDGKMSIALTDIYGTDKFLSRFDKKLSNLFEGLRHDSGDPYIWMDRVISHYKKNAIDPMSKTLVFSDGLDFNKAKDIYLYSKNKVKVVFGIGTNLSNDFDFKTLNIVMKMVKANGKDVVKISDEPKKAIGNSEIINKINSFNWEKI